jgi:endonuclease/exonuclease/phosphatase family metal-dependent hydrolase
MSPLQGWIAQRTTEGVPFLLLGDFNRWMDGRDDLFAGLSQSGALARPTEGQTSPCWGGGGFIDHILAGGAARGWMVDSSLRVMVFKETGPAWKQHLSDHCPVSARFRLPD